MYRKNDFVEISKTLGTDITSLKIILLDHQKNYELERLNVY